MKLYRLATVVILTAATLAAESSRAQLSWPAASTRAGGAPAAGSRRDGRSIRSKGAGVRAGVAALNLLGSPAHDDAAYLRHFGAPRDVSLAESAGALTLPLTPTERLLETDTSVQDEFHPARVSGPSRMHHSRLAESGPATWAPDVADAVLGGGVASNPVRAPFDGTTVYRSPW
jgi:hypothetical protein